MTHSPPCRSTHLAETLDGPPCLLCGALSLSIRLQRRLKCLATGSPGSSLCIVPHAGCLRPRTLLDLTESLRRVSEQALGARYAVTPQMPLYRLLRLSSVFVGTPHHPREGGFAGIVSVLRLLELVEMFLRPLVGLHPLLGPLQHLDQRGIIV